MIKTQASPLKSRLQSVNNTSDIIDYSAPIERIVRLLNDTQLLNEDVHERIQWLSDVINKTTDYNHALSQMEEWLPEVEKTIESLEPIKSDLDDVLDGIKKVQVSTFILFNKLKNYLMCHI